MAQPTGGCGPKDIYQALLSAGFGTAQAVGVMANAIAESNLDAETRVIDTNGYYSNGLWQFNEQSFPDSASLVTGNCQNDIQSQVGYLIAHISGNALTGSSGADVAGSFASNFERCQGCQQGGSSYSKRVANAQTVQDWVSTGNWPTSTAELTAATSGSGSSTSGGGASNCLTGEILGFCVISKSGARALVGAGLMVAGGFLVLPGLFLLAAFAFRGSGAQGATNQAMNVAERAPGYGQAIKYARRRASQRGSSSRAGAQSRAPVRSTRPGQALSPVEVRQANANRRSLQRSRARTQPARGRHAAPAQRQQQQGP